MILAGIIALTINDENYNKWTFIFDLDGVILTPPDIISWRGKNRK
jgi:hypothetical protein